MLGKVSAVTDVLMTGECSSFSQPRYISRHTDFADLCILATFSRRHTQHCVNCSGLVALLACNTVLLVRRVYKSTCCCNWFIK